MEALPSNYNFEIDKTVSRIKSKGATRVALQFPEGLLHFSIPIADELKAATGADMVILGDVTYGACCVEDLHAKALGCDFLVHYGHSCLVSIRDCVVANMMYVFVEIRIDVQHFVDTVAKLVSPHEKVALIATIQFVSSMRAAAALLKESGHFVHPMEVPQVKPLSQGELLGCTSPKINSDVETVLYIGDGRFHLESFMIMNPCVRALQYDPYKKSMSVEEYDHQEMRKIRHDAIVGAKGSTHVGVVMGTLGRQGNARLVNRLLEIIRRGGRKVTLFLMSEIFPAKLALIEDVDCFVQIACPRLSIDWGYAFGRPLLNPYECEVAFGQALWQETYPMDHYSKNGGPWGVYTDKTLDL